MIFVHALTPAYIIHMKTHAHAGARCRSKAAGPCIRSARGAFGRGHALWGCSH